MTTLRFDAARSSFKIETRAKGMLAKLAHDLSIEAREVSASARLEQTRVLVELKVVVARLEVAGVLKGERVDSTVLSPSDRKDIEKKIREEVLPSPEVSVTMELDLGAGGLEAAAGKSFDASGRIELGRKNARVTSRVAIAAADGGVTASGRVRVNLPALGIVPPKGPLGAFRVNDDVDVGFSAFFASSSSEGRA